MRSRKPTMPALCAALFLCLSTGSCGFIADFIDGPADEQLANEAVAHWATPGGPFMEGVYGRGNVDVGAETAEGSQERPSPFCCH